VAAIQIAPRLYVVGKQAQLARGPATLALKTGGRQTGFFAANGSDLCTTQVNLFGNFTQECGPSGRRAVSVRPNGVFCCLGGNIHQFRRANRKLISRPLYGSVFKNRGA